MAPGIVAGVVRPRFAWAVVQPSPDYYSKMSNFDAPHDSDLVAGNYDFGLLTTTLGRIKRVQRTVGYGNFNILGFDDMLKVAKRYASVERFSRSELRFLERLFYSDATEYGFYRTRVLRDLSDDIDRKKTVYIRGCGQRLFRGRALEKYRRIKSAVGDDLVLISGVRSVVKQLHLFMDKAARSDGSLSLASRSLASPGYSFHGVGDFDVGHRGLGPANFTNAFAETETRRRLVDLGFARIRYPQRNLLGVRFEPWHIRVL